MQAMRQCDSRNLQAARLTLPPAAEVRQQRCASASAAMAHAQAAVHRATAEVDYKWRYPPVMNDKAATEFAVKVAREFLGEQWLIPDLQPLQASDDFAIMLNQVPNNYFIVGNSMGEGSCMVHNAAYDFNDNLLPATASYWSSWPRAICAATEFCMSEIASVADLAARTCPASMPRPTTGRPPSPRPS